jgi:hypothetical protein
VSDPANPLIAHALAAIVAWHGSLNSYDFFQLLLKAEMQLGQDFPQILKEHQDARDKTLEARS